jgi:hypothetical protein
LRIELKGFKLWIDFYNKGKRMMNYNIPKLIVVAFIAINIWSCEEEMVDCEPFAIAVKDALTAYTTDRTEENCISYQAALQAGIDDGCDSNNVYQTQLSDLNCGCVGLDEAIVTASTNFIADPSTENCTAYKTALQSAVDGNCDPSGLYQEIINTLGDCSDPSSGIVCVNLISGVVTANQTYSMDPTNETCNAYRDSLMAAILGGCDTNSAFQVSFDSLNCDSIIVTPGDIEAAIALVEAANAELENVFSELYDSDEPDSIEAALNLFNFSEAYTMYAEAQYLDPDNNDANFGVALTGLMQITQDESFRDMIDKWDNYFANTTPFKVQSTGANILGRNGFGLPLNTNGLRVPVSTFVGMPLSIARMTLEDVPQFSELQTIINEVFLPYVDQGIAALAKVEQTTDYEFLITSDMQPDVGASSLELDLTEVYAVDMMLHVISGICNTVIAYNFDFITHDDDGIVAELNQGSEFAALNSSGESDLNNAYSAMTIAVDKLESALQHLQAETDDQSNDIIEQLENISDYDDIQEGIDDAREVLTQPIWVSYYTYEEGEGYDGYWYENEIEDSMQVDIQQFFSNPIEDMKGMVPPYTITAGIDTNYDHHWVDYEETFSVTLEPDADDIDNDWGYYFNLGFDYYDDSLRIYEYGPWPEELADQLQVIYEEVMEEYSEIEWLYISAWYEGPAGDITVNIRVEFEYGEMEGMFYYPVITWDANTFDEWKNGWPDPTFNGIFPNWTSDEMMEFLGMEEEDWQKTWD